MLVVVRGDNKSAGNNPMRETPRYVEACRRTIAIAAARAASPVWRPSDVKWP